MKLIPHFLWSIGFVLILIAAGKGSGAALPYQDPTPELVIVQRGQLQDAKLIAISGVLLVFTGAALVISRRFRRTAARIDCSHG